MEFNVAQLLREPIGSRREYHVEACDASGAEICGEVALLRTDRSILARADLETSVEVECSRCLALARVPAALAIEEEYYPTIDINSGAALPAPDDPAAFLLDKHHVLDLAEAVRQYLVLAEPMRPLCRPDCAGLCPRCGADLNLSRCACPIEEDGNAWAVLRGLALGPAPWPGGEHDERGR